MEFGDIAHSQSIDGGLVVGSSHYEDLHSPGTAFILNAAQLREGRDEIDSPRYEDF